MRLQIRLFLPLLLLAGVLVSACSGKKTVDPSSLRGLPVEQLQQMREEILEQAGGKPLSAEETALVEQIREQERRLENAWIFGEWRERHGHRLIFRDDGTVSVGARGGMYDELGVYKFISPEEPSFEAVWTLLFDASGDPVAVVTQPSGEDLLYPFHKERKNVYEWTGDLQTARETGCYYSKIL